MADQVLRDTDLPCRNCLARSADVDDEEQVRMHVQCRYISEALRCNNRLTHGRQCRPVCDPSEHSIQLLTERSSG